ncbi:relaxase/mobilization nuclease domain-containing protein [Moraxella sp. Tifton1]|uniref:relaxase/mobilization nuclease domain-containing protein n=1 Tax=Moraxella oculi TaxID=2940516 RepID=UPI0020123B37|nr:relaxase/mobilization nuclease domain-containing protein [Moraxella sp. Tifton1]MCL1624293.1 relaxase/mobilization nuclease domain-containing protein [Moraxella sp. Tifton1]
MIVKYLPRRGGGSVGATLDYLLGKNWKNNPGQATREQAKVLKGDPNLTQMIASSSPYKDKYTVGVLSFEEVSLDDDIKNQIMAEFERTTFAGLDDDQYNICWIEHGDKGRVELNFVIPKVELTTNKQLNPYYHRADLERIDTFKKYINAKYNLSDPDDPARRQATKLKKHNLPKNKKEIKADIHDLITNEIEMGNIQTRDDIICYLQDSIGLTIARITDKSISIADPQGGRNLRLTGAYYERDFTREAGQSQSQATSRDRCQHPRDTDSLRATKERLDSLCQAKSKYHQDHYQRPVQSIRLDSAHTGLQQGDAGSDKGTKNKSESVLTEPSRHQPAMGRNPGAAKQDQRAVTGQDNRDYGAVRAEPYPNLGRSSSTHQAADAESHEYSIQGFFRSIATDCRQPQQHTTRHIADQTSKRSAQKSDGKCLSADGHEQHAADFGTQISKLGSDTLDSASLVPPDPFFCSVRNTPLFVVTKQPHQDKIQEKRPCHTTTDSKIDYEQSIFDRIDEQISRARRHSSSTDERKTARDRLSGQYHRAQRQHDTAVTDTAHHCKRVGAELQDHHRQSDEQTKRMAGLINQARQSAADFTDRGEQFACTITTSKQHHSHANKAITSNQSILGRPRTDIQGTANELQDQFTKDLTAGADEIRDRVNGYITNTVKKLTEYGKPVRGAMARIGDTAGRISDRAKVIIDKFFQGSWTNVETGKELTQEDKEKIERTLTPMELGKLMKGAEKKQTYEQSGPSF